MSDSTFDASAHYSKTDMEMLSILHIGMRDDGIDNSVLAPRMNKSIAARERVGRERLSRPFGFIASFCFFTEFDVYFLTNEYHI